MSEKENTVEQKIFVCRKFSRISAISRKIPEREYYLLKIRENFLQVNCLQAKFAKISCREIFLFYNNKEKCN